MQSVCICDMWPDRSAVRGYQFTLSRGRNRCMHLFNTRESCNVEEEDWPFKDSVPTFGGLDMFVFGSISLAHRFRRNNLNVDCGDAGHRSPYLSHAKRALYHLSYIPVVFDGYERCWRLIGHFN
ncbi:hypothetical protein V6N12_019450 [Hibiscus sabdariffa]|uniref:Uncharacterized protein n=1 Tax=Hibiscus sabdariffa TaxID=183260 RepID=A0ABR2BML1_9ROSI